jgi:putative phage-type endonuclease
MALYVYNDLIQGSEEWLTARRGVVTASTVGRLITAKTLKPASNDESRGLTALLVAERITGWTDPTYVNFDMQRGNDCEPIARDIYSGLYSQAVECGFMLRTEDDWQLGYSPDGVVADDGLLEVKSPRAKTHLNTILADEVPPFYMAQLQAGLLVSGREWIDFLSFCGGMPLFCKRVLPDPKWHEAIVAACRQFEKTAAEMVAAYEAKTKGLPPTERVPDLEMSL